MVANIEAGGTGIDGLQESCRSVAFAEFADTPTDMEQAIKRIRRTGQKACTNCYYLIAPGTIDEDQAEILDERAGYMAQLVDGKELPETDFLSELIKRRLAKKRT